MKLKFILLGLIMIFKLTAVQSQTEYFGTLNPCNFNYSNIKEIPIMKSLKTATFDDVHRHYIFTGSSDAVSLKLYTIDAKDGKIISSPLFPVLTDPKDNLLNHEYSNSLNKLFALYWNDSTKTQYFVSINASTGVHALIDSLPGIAWINGNSTFDNINNRYMFEGADKDYKKHLYSINAIDGKIISSPTYTNLDGSFSEYQYSNSMNKLFALHWDNLSNKEYLAEINPSTGNFTNLKEIPNVLWIADGETTFDEYNKRYIFKGGDIAGNFYLYSIDALTGNIFCNPVFPVFPGKGNIVLPEIDSATGIMYALHLKDVNVGIKENKNHVSHFFPNPFKDHAKVILDKSYNEIMIFIYNLSGQLVSKQTADDSDEVIILRENLPAGQYFVSVICDHIFAETIKITIQ